jgi:hypothetical protein
MSDMDPIDVDLIVSMVQGAVALARAGNVRTLAVCVNEHIEQYREDIEHNVLRVAECKLRGKDKLAVMFERSGTRMSDHMKRVVALRTQFASWQM